MQEFITLASDLADQAGSIARQYFRTPFDVESKKDASPVTIADRTIEQYLRDHLAQTRPDDGILGEEFDNKPSKNGLTWVIDPIDGTKSFIIGRPTFGTLIALCENDVPILGLIDQPITQERWIGARGQQTTFNGAPAKTRPCPALDKAVTASTTPAMFAREEYKAFAHNGSGIVWGTDCYAYGLLASGHLDMVLEDDLKPFDFAALIPVIEGAGGFIRDWQGAPLTLQSKGQVIALGDAALWTAVKEKLKGA